jgi:hypothetical protein
LWTRRYNSPSDNSDEANAVGVSPDGSKLYVTGGSEGEEGYFDYATVAYDGATGAVVWSRRYKGPSTLDIANALGVSPDGARIYVTGKSFGESSDEDYATVAYDGSTGAELWTTRYNGPGNSQDIANALGVSSDGSRVYVTGESKGGTVDYATVFYQAATGDPIQLFRDGGPGDDYANALGVSPNGSNGSSVYVTGGDEAVNSRYDYRTVAYPG